MTEGERERRDSPPGSEGSSGARRRRTEAAGLLAATVAAELVRPLRELREDLAVLVEQLDRHMSEARGPKGLTWKDVENLRQQLAANYLRSRRLTRLLSELADAIAPGPAVPETADMNKLVESALNLSRHRIAADTEVFIDLGSVPLVRVMTSDILLVMALMVEVAAASASKIEGSAISIKTRREQADDGEDEEIVVYVADNGAGEPNGAGEVSQLAGEVAVRAGGSFVGTSEPGIGSAFELHLPAGRR